MRANWAACIVFLHASNLKLFLQDLTLRITSVIWFAVQDLTLTISTERAEAELELEEDTNEISSINVQSFVDEQEWELHSHVETWKKITTKVYQNSKFKHPSFSTSCRASRRPGFFIWNIFLVMVTGNYTYFFIAFIVVVIFIVWWWWRRWRQMSTTTKTMATKTRWRCRRHRRNHYHHQHRRRLVVVVIVVSENMTL